MSDKATDAGPQMTCDQYFQQFKPTLHIYNQAAVRGEYRGTLKTREEWDTIMEDMGFGS